VLDLGRVVYLDAQKTGSTFLSDFLSTHSGLEVISFGKHAPITEQQTQRETVSLLISIRRPGPYYLSLFRYGLDGKGEIFNRVKNAGRISLYQPKVDCFEAFLGFLNDGESNGLQTRRLLRIMNLKSPTSLPSADSQESKFRLEDFVRLEELKLDLNRREPEWAEFGRLSKLVVNQPKLLALTAASRFQTGPAITSPRLKFRINRNRSKASFTLSRQYLDKLDSPEGPIGELERPIFELYDQMALRF
jgi:hypothetical protein